MKKYAIMSILGAALIASPALAQDAEEGISGPYFGIMGGYDEATLESEGTEASEGGVMYGIYAGYDIPFDSLIVGIEAELSESDIDVDLDAALGAGTAAAVRLGDDYYVGGRVGALISDDAVVYLKGGYTRAQLTGAVASGAGNFVDDTSVDGYRVGGGLEFGSQGITGRIEYRYSNYGGFDNLDEGLDFNSSRTQIVVGIGYRF